MRARPIRRLTAQVLLAAAALLMPAAAPVVSRSAALVDADLVLAAPCGAPLTVAERQSSEALGPLLSGREERRASSLFMPLPARGPVLRPGSAAVRGVAAPSTRWRSSGPPCTPEPPRGPPAALPA